MAGSVEYRWSGEVMEPADGLAYLGHNPMDDRNVYVITGDSGNGMTHCTAGAILVTDLILRRPNIWSELYAPTRQPFQGGPRERGGLGGLPGLGFLGTWGIA
jgi:glycine/D-amino acid oxidase-like deaminating enzyme